MQTISKEIKIPYSVFDITLSQYLDYEKSVERYKTLVKDTEGYSDETFSEEKATIIEAVSFVCQGDLYSIPFIDETKDESATIYTKDDSSEDFTIVGLFYHIQNIIQNYQVDSDILNKREYSFTYKGEMFYLNGGQGDNLKTGVTIETLEIERLYNLAKRNNGDTEGVKEFTKICTTLAILCRKKGEQLPLNKNERKQFIDQRVEFFKDITLNVSNDIAFFLLNIIVN